MTFDDIHTLAMSLPGVSVAAKWGNRTWVVADRGFAWQRPFSKADLNRFGDTPPPAGEILALWVGTLEAKEALLAIAPPGFFTIPHFNGYPGILIALEQARAKDVRRALKDAYAIASVPKPKRKAKPKSKPRRRVTRSV